MSPVPSPAVVYSWYTATREIRLGGRLRAKQIGALRPGRHGDGGTLFLVVEPGGRSRHWVQRLTINGKRRDLGLGGYPYVGLAEARAAAFANRQLARRGGDPTTAVRQSRAPRFRTACERVEAGATWKGLGAENRRRALERYCGSIMGRRIDQIRRTDVIAILSPVMAEKRATGSKLHGWIRGALAWGVAGEHIEFNVADGIRAALPSARKAKKHHAALPYSEVGSALEAIAGCTANEAVQLSSVHCPDGGSLGWGTGRDVERDRPARGRVAHTGGAHEGGHRA